VKKREDLDSVFGRRFVHGPQLTQRSADVLCREGFGLIQVDVVPHLITRIHDGLGVVMIRDGSDLVLVLFCKYTSTASYEIQVQGEVPLLIRGESFLDFPDAIA
jgi:hypothetical protein